MSASTSSRPPSTSNFHPSRRELYEETLNGTQTRPSIPVLWSDRSKSPISVPRSLDDYRALEGREPREARLRAIWKRLPKTERKGVRVHPDKAHERAEAHLKPANMDSMTKEGAESLREMYREELMDRSIDWNGFLNYADNKEAELWHIFHDQLDLDGNGHVDSRELRLALTKAGIQLSTAELSEFMTYLTSSPHSHAISFPEFRDFLLLLPRTASTAEMYRYYEVRKFLGDDGHGVARVNMEGDVTLSAEDRHPLLSNAASGAETYIVPGEEEREQDGEEDPHASFFAMVGHSQAFRFLLAGGLAGAVSRTATAPFDRLKVFLITRSTSSVAELMKAGDVPTATKSVRGMAALMEAIRTIHTEQGLRGFWVGNGLNVVKIFPESAIKFLSYESSKRFLAKHVDKVGDPRDISGTSRFISGGIGGIISQFTIYPLETLKTQMMSSGRGEKKSSLSSAAKRTWELGGVRAYYRGLVIGLVGVFPYSAIDMSTFESLKLIYSRSTGVEEPGVLALLAFGSISGTVGATSVYPLNLVRTRLQASGSPGHPQRYKDLGDVVRQTMQQEGWKGFYRGLAPTLAKVVPAVSISYVVYENSKRR
ncbi:hypothetical protein FRB96_002213 [Tulasnella sp. 330]|nr:hypothetical protein FRB96_002213 [Tulasnella sp. 330]KAG8887317.1 hypothetical protein FRB98_000245 [Tulasnella sp. 332]